MLKEDVLKKLTDCGLVAVVRANNAEEAIKISDACLAGGCTGIELTFTVPGADKVIAALAEKYSNIVAIKKDAAIDIVFKYIMLLYFK